MASKTKVNLSRRRVHILNEKCDASLNGLKIFRFFSVLYSLFFMDTSEVLAPGEFALVSYVTAFNDLKALVSTGF